MSPMTLEEYQKIWSEDCKINSEELDIASLSIPVVHSKYLTFLSQERKRIKALEATKDFLESQLKDYYAGAIDGKDINRPPFQLRLTTNSQINERVSKDKDMIKANLKIAECENSILFLKAVLDSINQRNWIIRNAIEWRKFTSGAGL